MYSSDYQLNYPFVSPEVRAIAANLTPEERERLRRFGLRMAPVCAVAGLVTILPVLVLMLLQAFKSLVVPFLVGIPIGWALWWIVSIPMRRAMRRLLCETEYARQQGYTPEMLPLNAVQFSLRTLMLWGVPLAAICASIIAWDGPLTGKQAPLNGLLKFSTVLVLVTGAILIGGMRRSSRTPPTS